MRTGFLIVALIVLKAWLLTIDDTVRIYLGDSAAYLYGAQDDGKLPDDRSFTYSFIIRAVAYPHQEVRRMLTWQSGAGVVVALLLYLTLVRRFGAPRAAAFAAAGLLALEPAQLYYERMLLAESFGLLAFVTFFACCSAYLASGRWWWIPIAALWGIAAVSLRLNYLPVVLVISLLLPAIGLMAGPGGRPVADQRRSHWRRDLAVALVSVALVHGAYCSWVAYLFDTPPGYLGRAGFMRLGLVLPLARPEHFAAVGLSDIERQLDYPIDDPHMRMPHLWAPGGLIAAMRARNLDVDGLSRELSRRAVLEDPLGPLRLGLTTLRDYFDPEEIGHALHNDLGHREIPYDVIWTLREHWGYDARGLNSRVTAASRYFELGTWWLVLCLFILPVVSVMNLVRHWSAPSRAQALLASLFGVGLFVAHLLFVPVALYRYIHPLPFFVLLNLVPVIARVRR
jgi:hypothetical protein